jgi:hypothetical protein
VLGNNNSSLSQVKSIILGRPTNTAVTASILFNQNVQYFLEYGTVSGNYPTSTSTFSNVLNVPDEVDLSNLVANTKYFYRMQYKLVGTSTFTTTPEYSFNTQRSAGSSLTFTIESDEHLYDIKGNRSMYQVTLANEAADNPDFMLPLGDIFGDDHTPLTTSSADMDALHKDYRQYLGQICHSIPFYVCLGNHEGENDYYLNQMQPNNIGVWGTQWRKYYYPNPYPNSFYTGNTAVENYGINTPEINMSKLQMVFFPHQQPKTYNLLVSSIYCICKAHNLNQLLSTPIYGYLLELNYLQHHHQNLEQN